MFSHTSSSALEMALHCCPGLGEHTLLKLDTSRYVNVTISKTNIFSPKVHVRPTVSVLFVFNHGVKLYSSVAAGQAHGHRRKFVLPRQAVGGKITLRTRNSSPVSAASPHVVSLPAAHINILWRSRQCVNPKKKKY